MPRIKITKFCQNHWSLICIDVLCFGFVCWLTPCRNTYITSDYTLSDGTLFCNHNLKVHLLSAYCYKMVHFLTIQYTEKTADCNRLSFQAVLISVDNPCNNQNQSAYCYLISVRYFYKSPLWIWRAGGVCSWNQQEAERLEDRPWSASCPSWLGKRGGRHDLWWKLQNDMPYRLAW
jgi:hypothetical protein